MTPNVDCHLLNKPPGNSARSWPRGGTRAPLRHVTATSPHGNRRNWCYRRSETSISHARDARWASRRPPTTWSAILLLRRGSRFLTRVTSPSGVPARSSNRNARTHGTRTHTWPARWVQKASCCLLIYRLWLAQFLTAAEIFTFAGRCRRGQFDNSTVLFRPYMRTTRQNYVFA